MEAFVPIALQLLAGAAGGNIIGSVLKNVSLGTAGNSIAGGVGGLLGGLSLPLLGIGGAAVPEAMTAASGLDLGSIVGSVVGGGVGGAILTAIAGAVKKAMAKT